MTPKEEVEELLNAGLPFAQDMLLKHGEFQPFGAVMTPESRVDLVAGYDGEDPLPADGVVALLMDGFLKGAAEGRYKAIALFMNVTVDFGESQAGEQTLAIQAGLEHQAGYCANVFLPYVEASDTDLEFQDLIAARRDGGVFGTP